MRSSRTDDRLAALGADYDRALAALLAGDLDRVGRLLDACDRHLAALADRGPLDELDEGARALHAHAADSQGCLVDALMRARESTRAELRKVREGRRAVQSYGRAAGRP
jgi:hypothetical protein